MKLSEYRKILEKEKSIAQHLQKQIQETQETINYTEEELVHGQDALELIQQAAKATQEQLEYQLSELVSIALKDIFKDPYEMVIRHVVKRGKTEALLRFSKRGHEVHPLMGAGGGTVDVASLTLRLSLLSLSKNRRVLILDEPWKSINDSTRELHRKMVLMLKKIQQELGVQIIVVSQIPELADVADKVFEVVQVEGKSEIKTL